MTRVLVVVALVFATVVACSGTSSDHAPSVSSTSRPHSTRAASLLYDVGTRRLAGAFYAADPEHALGLGQRICASFKAGVTGAQNLYILLKSRPKGATVTDQREVLRVSVRTLCPRYLPKVEKASR